MTCNTITIYDIADSLIFPLVLHPGQNTPMPKPVKAQENTFLKTPINFTTNGINLSVTEKIILLDTLSPLIKKFL